MDERSLALIITDGMNDNLNNAVNILKVKNIDVVHAYSIDDGIKLLQTLGEKIHLIITRFNESDNGLFSYTAIQSMIIPIIVVLKEDQNNLKTISLLSGANVVLVDPVVASDILLYSMNMLKALKISDNFKGAQKIILTLTTALEYKDGLTKGHSKRTADAAALVYDNLGFKDKTIRYKLFIGSLLHDTGKIGIPDNILKSEKLFEKTDKEFETLKTHPIMGYEICKELNDKIILDLIMSHHEKLDGSGYPKGLKGGEIPAVVKILSLVDVYDALVHKRHYRENLSPDEAFKIIKNEVTEHRLSYDVYQAFKDLIEDGSKIDSKLTIKQPVEFDGNLEEIE